VFVGCGVDAHVEPEAFGVQTPVFAERGQVEIASEARDPVHFRGLRELVMMAGHPFVKDQRRQHVQRSLIETMRIDHTKVRMGV
jgi:hypothetical protein